jgi:hypothetical protein
LGCVGEEARTCPPGLESCDGACVNVRLEPDHCGACGNACPVGELCTRGACAVGCQGGTEQCGELCIDTEVDPDNCGDCGNACAADEVCSQGQCGLQCGGGTSQCGQSCVDTMLDPNHCGGCDQPCPSSACIAGECGDAPSCRRLLAAQPGLPSGLYTIDPDGQSGNAPFQVWCDMENDGGGWTRIANIAETTVLLNGASYLAGLGDVNATSYLQACSKFAGFGEETVARLTMGSVIDFFKPTAGNDVCAMLQTNDKHRWSAALTGAFVEPVYHSSATTLGGSASGWPTDGRIYLTFWGGNGATSGCCHNTYTSGSAWNRTFVIDVREP